MLKAKAKQIYEHSQDADGFNASSGWLHGFKAVMEFADSTAFDRFKHKLFVLIKKRRMWEEQIYNVLESGIFWIVYLKCCLKRHMLAAVKRHH